MGGRAESAVEVDVALPSGPSFAAVARLVVAGLAARSGLSVARVEELQLAVNAILRRSAAGDARDVSIRMRPGDDRFGLRVGPLPEPADLEHVLSGLVDEVSSHDVGGETWLDLVVECRALAPAGR